MTTLSAGEKPRPVVVVTTSAPLRPPAEGCVVVPMTSQLSAGDRGWRLAVEPSTLNGLAKSSQLMIDRVAWVRLRQLSQPIGRLEPELMEALDKTLLTYLGLG